MNYTSNNTFNVENSINYIHHSVRPGGITDKYFSLRKRKVTYNEANIFAIKK